MDDVFNEGDPIIKPDEPVLVGYFVAERETGGGRVWIDAREPGDGSRTWSALKHDVRLMTAEEIATLLPRDAAKR
jgi:hypothetical protein